MSWKHQVVVMLTVENSELENSEGLSRQVDLEEPELEMGQVELNWVVHSWRGLQGQADAALLV